MKVTALISDELIKRVQQVSGGKNITESLIIALEEYTKQKEISYLMDEVNDKSLQFNEKTATYIRKINRNR